MRVLDNGRGWRMLRAGRIMRLHLTAVAAAIGLLGGAMLMAQSAGYSTRGKALTESSGCFECHRIDQHGSRLGPDLSDIGTKRTPERIQDALTDPDAEVLFENRFVKFVTKDGATVTGRLLNQDALSVQLINSKEELKTYMRATLRDYTIVDKGLMPSVKDKLTDQQVADIVAYLSSLKGS
jgi:putative heme-binding domain-containing protein